MKVRVLWSVVCAVIFGVALAGLDLILGPSTGPAWLHYGMGAGWGYFIGSGDYR